MYLHLGQDVMVPVSDIIGIFDIDNATISGMTRAFLKEAEQDGQVINVSYELPKSFVLCCDKNQRKKVYIAQISSATLWKRAQTICGSVKVREATE